MNHRSPGPSHTRDAVRNRHHAGCPVAVERAADPYTLRRRPRLSGGSPKYIYAGRGTYGNASRPPRTTPDQAQWRSGDALRSGIDAPSSIVEPVAARNDISESPAPTSRAQAATSARCPTWIDGTGDDYAVQRCRFSAVNYSWVRSG